MSQPPPKKLTDEEIKAAARSGGEISRPGIVSVSGAEAARLDQRIAAKRSGVSTASSTDSVNSSGSEGAESDTLENRKAPPAALGRLEQDLQAKQRGRANGMAAATQPGAMSSGKSSNNTTAARAELNGLEADVAAKNRARAPAAAAHTELNSLEADVAAKNRARAPVASRPGAVNSAESLDQKVAAKVRSSQPAHAEQLQQLESSVAGKMRTSAPATMPGATASLAQFEDQVTAKTGGRAATAISRLDDRIATKNAMHSSTATASNTPRHLQDAEDEVLKKKSVPGSGVSSSSDAPQTKHDDAMPPEQFLGGKDDVMDHRHQEGLMAGTGDNLRGTDLEYGVYGGPGENGLAVAFAVEEDDEDMFIPSAVEYDPDAKPPMYRNRRFRLYAFLAIVVVVVVTIGAAVGITLSNKREVPEIPYRETLGIRENIERIVGSDVLDDYTNAYRKALDWITYDDPKAIIPEDNTFAQRFYAAYFYLATSVEHPWSGGCNPPVGDEPDHCLYNRLVSTNPIEYSTIPWVRWLSGQSECNWAGVACDESGQVRTLELSGVNMTGTFPDVSGFPFLQSLGLFYSELNGPLPDSIGEMKHLTNLEIQGHAFTGTVPDSWYRSRSLQRINLNYNQLSGPLKPEIRHMKDTKGLFFSGNLFTGQIPDEISQMPSVSYLRLDRNKFSGTIPTVLGSMHHLEELWLHENELTGVIPTQLGQLSGMQDLLIHTNALSGPIPEEVYNITKLFRFDAHGNQLTGTISPMIGKLFQMDSFRVESNRLTGNVPSEMGLLTSLRWMHLSGNDLVGSVPAEVCMIQSLEELEVDCAAPYNGVPELACTECCTTCCDTEGENCYPIISGNGP